jgi:hypothetical protein
VAKYAIDLSPLRKSKDFSLLWAAGLISYFGSMITYVAVPFQVKQLTGSYVAVAISGLVVGRTNARGINGGGYYFVLFGNKWGHYVHHCSCSLRPFDSRI